MGAVAHKAARAATPMATPATATATVVTCYYRIPSKHSYDSYDAWSERFLASVDTPMVIFCDAGSAARLAALRARVADLLEIDIDQVSIKAKTPEGLNLDHVAQCHAVALVERVVAAEGLKSMSAVIESQRQLEDVVEDLLSSVHGVPKKRVAPVYDTEDIT